MTSQTATADGTATTTTGRAPHARICDAGTDVAEAFPEARTELRDEDAGRDRLLVTYPDAPAHFEQILRAIAQDNRVEVDFYRNDHARIHA